MTTNLPEAPASLNFTGISSKGWRIQFTLRGDDEIKLLDRFAAFVKLLEEYHVTPNGHAEPSHVISQRQTADVNATPEAEEHTEGAPELPKAKAQIATAVEEYFEAETLEGSMNKGKVYWKVKGGKFSKYGVTIWPEVLKEAGINTEELDPAQIYNMSGKAYYTLTDDGKPQKVVRLVRQ